MWCTHHLPINQSALQTESDKARRRTRSDTAFVECLENTYCRFLRPWTAILVGVTLLNTIIRLSIFFSNRPSVWNVSHGKNSFLAIPAFPISSNWFFYSTPFYILLPFVPIIPRLIVYLTDLWGNARLQSLFLFHHERRYRSVPISSHEGWLRSSWLHANSRKSDPLNRRDIAPRHSTAVSDSDSTSSSLFSETGLSRPSSADTAMSISRVPWSKQVQEIRNVFRQVRSLKRSCFFCV
eukprot:Gregarina_sp_Poly_1__7865@NODE_446_length_8330_cov_67_406269_g364_i0_p4_GENE_NODE_446_length_8330_cov_67_406269_g364_i0NODE_446_length_8330_cov_67_406269_g364_i0_p4_ORF_typecomplete_len238_score4_72_NODE_446_length_8330_cov_67_406269_g364_i069137626